MAKKDYTQLSKDIVRNVGGEGNVISVFHCATRLRFKVKDKSKVKLDTVKQLSGVITAMDSGGQIQVVIGNHVPDVFEAVLQNSNIKAEASADGGDESSGKKGLLNVFMETISGIFAPMLGAMSGAGMLKALLILLTTLGVLNDKMGTYKILYAAADGVFVFLPMFLAITAARKFNCNQFVALGVAAALVYPDMTAASSAGEAMTFLKIPVVLISYTSSVMPIIISIYVLSKLEKLLKKIVPDVCRTFLTPMLSLMVMVPATYLVIGPVMDRLGKLLASGYTTLVGFNPMIAGGFVGLIWPAAVIFGVHWGFVPIVMNNLAEFGRDTLFVITGPNNMAQAGATLGVFLKTKDKDLKEMSGPAALSAVLAGITEPAIYGVTLPYKKPFFIGAIFSGIAGAIVAQAGTSAPTLLGTSLLTLPGYVGVGFVAFLIACAIAYFGAAIVTYLVGFDDSMLNKGQQGGTTETEAIGEKPAEDTGVMDEQLVSVAAGQMIELSKVSDEAFSSGAMGKGVAIVPKEGRFYAPCDGTISAMFPTGHAVGLLSDKGAEILIHIGMDTVSLNGDGFDVKVKQDQKVKQGDLLVVADLAKIKGKGLDITTPVIITNTDDYADVLPNRAGNVSAGSDMMSLVAK